MARGGENNQIVTQEEERIFGICNVILNLNVNLKSLLNFFDETLDEITSGKYLDNNLVKVKN